MIRIHDSGCASKTAESLSNVTYTHSGPECMANLSTFAHSGETNMRSLPTPGEMLLCKRPFFVVVVSFARQSRVSQVCGLGAYVSPNAIMSSLLSRVHCAWPFHESGVMPGCDRCTLRRLVGVGRTYLDQVMMAITVSIREGRRRK